MIVRHREPEAFVVIQKVGGKDDGEEWRHVEAEMNDGTTRGLWISNMKQGYFKQVFVPWNFEHPEVAE